MNKTINSKRSLLFAYVVSLSLIGIFAFPLKASASWKNLGGSINISNNAGLSRSPSVATDSQGYPHLAWYDNSGGVRDIYYLKWNGLAWVDADGGGQESINVSNSALWSGDPSLQLDSQGRPHIVWTDIDFPNLNGEISYLYYNGSAWVDVDGVGQGEIDIYAAAEGSETPQITLKLSDCPHVVWMEGLADEQIYYLQWNGSSWVDVDGAGQESIDVSNNSSDSRTPGIDLDSSGKPYLAWQDSEPTNYDIYFVKWNGSAWVDVDGVGQESINISNNAGLSGNLSLALSSDGTLFLSYNDDTPTNYEIYFTYWPAPEGDDPNGLDNGIEVESLPQSGGEIFLIVIFSFLFTLLLSLSRDSRKIRKY